MLGNVTLYAVIAGGILVLLICWGSRRRAPYPYLRYFTLRRIVYPLFIRRRGWTSVAYIDGVFLGLYVTVNAFCLGFGIDGLDESGKSLLMRRSSLLSVINTVLLFLGGRTNIFVDGFGMPLHTYYLAHH